MYIEKFPAAFEPSVNVPLDKRTKIADITSADAVFLATAYVGLVVYDEATSTLFKITSTDGTQDNLTYEELGGG
ncbi:hypothetical protein [Vibrio phage vB_VmeM-Yong XC32]|nr:hypothetical protein [Vibrio phage vB_VmeM-Yong XC31]QAX96571.1 hypothetical protein [Vibrio phage vB_VmeM-Yong XC32]QAX96889.1 hypothetical protein [Vibrio phage vB_VmeM-Yong MS31]QAX97194.1 hypothetical protein [Vibrio phage vB_VmeM-Yong MS32]